MVAVVVVPDALILSFFRDVSKALSELDCPTELQGQGLSLADCRRFLLDKQKSILNRSVSDYNLRNSNISKIGNSSHHHASAISADAVQGRLATLKHESSTSISSSTTSSSTTSTSTSNAAEIQHNSAMNQMNESARLALCRLVLYSECHWKNQNQIKIKINDNDSNNHRTLQSDGRLDRSRLLDFVALCQAAIQLQNVKKHLIDGSPLFDDLKEDNDDDHDHDDTSTPTAMQFPQSRLEQIQQLLSKAVGWEPDFTTKEIRRLFFEPDQSEYAKDVEIVNKFQQLVRQMNTAVTNASLQASKQQLSDLDKGGVTRVVSVQYSEISPQGQQQSSSSGGNGNGNGEPKYTINAPSKTSINPECDDDEEEQKRQIRMASQAAVLQQELLDQLLAMSEHDRNILLQEAQGASEDFMKQVMTLPPGRDRLGFLQSVNAHTSRLLAIHKVWTNLLAANNGKPSPSNIT